MARPHLKRDKRFNQSQQYSIISVHLKNSNLTRASTRPAPSSVCTRCQTSSSAYPSYLNNPHLSTVIRLYWVLNVFWYTSILFEKPSPKPQPCMVVRLYSVLNVSCTRLTYWGKSSVKSQLDLNRHQAVLSVKCLPINIHLIWKTLTKASARPARLSGCASVLNVFLYMRVHLIWRREKKNHQSLGYISAWSSGCTQC